jgi:hypothetical protein
MSIGDGHEADYLFDARHYAHAVLTRRPGRDEHGMSIVQQAGPVSLWEAIEDAVTTWRQNGEPSIDQFRIRASPAAQSGWIEGAPGAAWHLR